MQRELDWTKLAAGDSTVVMWMLKRRFKVDLRVVLYVWCVMCPMCCVVCGVMMTSLVAAGGEAWCRGPGCWCRCPECCHIPGEAHTLHTLHWQHSDRSVWLHETVNQTLCPNATLTCLRSIVNCRVSQVWFLLSIWLSLLTTCRIRNEQLVPPSEPTSNN